MRLLLAVLLLAFLAAPAHAAFGYGVPTFSQVDAPEDLPHVENAGEPSIGIDRNTDELYYQAFASTYKVVRSADGKLTWSDITNPAGLGVNADPMLHTDPVTGRTWAGGLLTVCSVISFTDDGGTTWSESVNPCGVYGVDHQTIGSGPFAGSPPAVASYERAVYYCAHGEGIQGGLGPANTGTAFSVASPTACATSLDGGVTFGPPVPWTGGCGSLHGHVRVSEVTGFAAVPDADCRTGAGSLEDAVGFAHSADNGLTWSSTTVPGSSVSAPTGNGFPIDPSIGFGHDEGWLWLGHAGEAGVYIGLSKDEGATWETIGGQGGTNATTWLNVGQFHNPPIVRGVFADVQAGDDDRVAFSFIGLEDLDGDGRGDEYAGDNTCDSNPENRRWHYYVATSYDAGATWRVSKATTDPVQVGGIFHGQEFFPDCRNLLDFNDMDIDSQGRIFIGFADGCIGDCATTGVASNDRGTTQRAAMIVQTGGRGLFSASDVAPPPGADRDGDGIPDDEDDDIDGDGIPNDQDDDPDGANTKKTPFLGTAWAALVLAVLAVGLRGRNGPTSPGQAMK